MSNTKYNTGDLVLILTSRRGVGIRYKGQIGKVVKSGKYMQVQLWDAELNKSVVLCFWKKELAPLFTL